MAEPNALAYRPGVERRATNERPGSCADQGGAIVHLGAAGAALWWVFTGARVPDGPGDDRHAHPPPPHRRRRAPRRGRRARRSRRPRLLLRSGRRARRRRTGAAGLTEAGYWAFVDPIAERMDHLWDDGDRCYRVGGEAESAINAALLTIHAVAALRDHRGAARADARGRALAGRMCEAPPWSERAHPSRPDKMFHVGGWLSSLHSAGAGMEKSVDPKVAEGLACAWRARDVLGLAGRATCSAWPPSCSAARTEPSSATPTSASTRSTGTPRSSPTRRR